jgi:hypothetical protein
MDGAMGIRKIGSICSISRKEDFDLSRLHERPPRLNIERQRSFDERSLSELSIGGKSGFNKSARNSFEPRLMVADAWESLRKSQVYYKA